MSANYHIEDSPPLIEKVVFDVPARTGSFLPDSGMDDCPHWFGGSCYLPANYSVVVPATHSVIRTFTAANQLTFLIGEPNMATSDLSTLAGNIEDALEWYPGIVASVNIIPTSYAGNVITYTINVRTNAPLGVLRFRNPSGDDSDPDSIIVTGFTKV